MNAIVSRPTASPMVPVLTPQTFNELMTFAKMAADSDLVPRDFKGKPANIVIAVQMGAELGLQPMQSLSGIAVVNGRAAVWGDALIGLCRQSPLCEDIREWFEGEGDARVAHCEARRRGASPTLSSFGVVDAKTAGLWKKQGPWTQYPDRMMQARARGFALRDAFPDLLRGLKTVEEIRDFPREAHQAPVDVTPPRAAAPAPAARPAPPTIDQVLNGDDIPSFDEPPPPKPKAMTPIMWVDGIIKQLDEMTDIDAYNALQQGRGFAAGIAKLETEFPGLHDRYDTARQEALDRIAATDSAAHAPVQHDDDAFGGEP